LGNLLIAPISVFPARARGEAKDKDKAKAKAKAKAKDTLYKGAGERRKPIMKLLGLPMHRMLPVKGAILLDLQATGGPLLVLGGGIVLVFAFRTLEVNDLAWHYGTLKDLNYIDVRVKRDLGGALEGLLSFY
jgi:hypothetical protein